MRGDRRYVIMLFEPCMHFKSGRKAVFVQIKGKLFAWKSAQVAGWISMKMCSEFGRGRALTYQAMLQDINKGETKSLISLFSEALQSKEQICMDCNSEIVGYPLSL